MQVGSATNIKATSAVAVLLCVSSLFALAWGLATARSSRDTILDFKIVYYGSRCLVQHCDPYNQNELLKVYFREGGAPIQAPSEHYHTQLIVASQMYLPTAAILLAPFGLFSWPVAYFYWIALTVLGLTAAAILIWRVAHRWSENTPLYLISFLLLNSGVLFAGGNPAGVAVSLCVISACCFLENRVTSLGIACMALSLAIKPHDAGLVWLFFLLVGGNWRKLALKSLALTVLIGVVALISMHQISPHWLQELQANVAEFAQRGSYNDPGPAAVKMITTGMRIDLETVTSVIRDVPRFYKTAAYLLCAPLVVYWGFLTVRSNVSRKTAWFALATIAPLAMLPVYHRPYDAKLLLLTIPACAALIARGRVIRWFSVCLTAGGIVITSDLPLAMLSIIAKGVHIPGGIMGVVMNVILMRPVPLVLFALGSFNLLQYARICREEREGASRARSLHSIAMTSD